MIDENFLPAMRQRIAGQVREARESAGMSMRQLAEKAGLTHRHIARVEDGTKNVTIDTLALVARALGITIEIK